MPGGAEREFESSTISPTRGSTSSEARDGPGRSRLVQAEHATHALPGHVDGPRRRHRHLHLATERGGAGGVDARQRVDDANEPIPVLLQRVDDGGVVLLRDPAVTRRGQSVLVVLRRDPRDTLLNAGRETVDPRLQVTVGQVRGVALGHDGVVSLLRYAAVYVEEVRCASGAGGRHGAAHRECGEVAHEGRDAGVAPGVLGRRRGVRDGRERHVGCVAGGLELGRLLRFGSAGSVSLGLGGAGGGRGKQAVKHAALSIGRLGAAGATGHDVSSFGDASRVVAARLTLGALQRHRVFFL